MRANVATISFSSLSGVKSATPSCSRMSDILLTASGVVRLASHQSSIESDKKMFRVPAICQVRGRWLSLPVPVYREVGG